jgi:hypothetical protein
VDEDEDDEGWVYYIMFTLVNFFSSSSIEWDLAEGGWDLAEGGWDQAEWLQRLTAHAEVATVLGSIPASSDTVESDTRQMKHCWIQYIFFFFWYGFLKQKF